MSEGSTLIRRDRIGIYAGSGWESKVPLLGADYGDIWLADDGQVGFFKTAWYGENWQTTLNEIHSVREVSRATALRCYQGMFPDRMIDISFSDKRLLLSFTGIIKFKTTADNLISHIPGVHHLGAAVVDLKSGWANRGTGPRAREAREFWWKTLTGRTVPLSGHN
jgi:hypothetical protein